MNWMGKYVAHPQTKGEVFRGQKKKHYKGACSEEEKFLT